MPDPTQLLDSNGRALPGYLNASAGPGKPAVVVIHEWWGLNQQIRGVVDRLAKEGFITFAPDLYHGKLATDGASAAKLAGSLDWNRAAQDLKAAVGALGAREPGARVGIVGFCMGGAVALMGAAKLPELAACVPYYGIPDGVDLSRIQAAVQGHFARHDDWCTPARVDELERTLRKAQVRSEIHRYDAAHAFANEARPEVHDPARAAEAWDRTVKFLRAHLAA
jgi:carboxymethylenebutenolidase